MSIPSCFKKRINCFYSCGNLSPNPLLEASPSPQERGFIYSKSKESSLNLTKDESGNNGPKYITTDPSTFRKLKPFSRNNRRNLTEAERIIWNAIRNRKLGPKFRRQHIIGKYIVDFVCLELKLIIEIDGRYHDSKDQQEYDILRTENLKFFRLQRVKI